MLEQSVTNKKQHNGIEASEYDRLSRSAVTLTTSALAGNTFTGALGLKEQSSDGSKLIAGVPRCVVRMPSIEDDASNGAPGSDKPLQQHLRAQSLRIRFANKSSEQNEKQSGGEPSIVRDATSSWVRADTQNEEGYVWVKNARKSSRRVLPVGGEEPKETLQH